MRSLGGGSNRYTGHIDLSGAQAHKISISGPETSKIGRERSLFVENYKLTNVTGVVTAYSHKTRQFGGKNGRCGRKTYYNRPLPAQRR
jgi:hypothetical protein